MLRIVRLWSGAHRAGDLLGVNVEDLDLANKQAVIVGKGGNAERIFWSSVTAQLLPRLVWPAQLGTAVSRRPRPSPARTPAAADRCPHTGRARLSYRRAAELFKQHSGGRTLHKLRHSRLTHLAEADEDATLIKAKSHMERRHRAAGVSTPIGVDAQARAGQLGTAVPRRPRTGVGAGHYLYLVAFGYGTVTGFGRDPLTDVQWQLEPCVGDDHPRCAPATALSRAGPVRQP